MDFTAIPQDLAGFIPYALAVLGGLVSLFYKLKAKKKTDEAEAATARADDLQASLARERGVAASAVDSTAKDRGDATSARVEEIHKNINGRIGIDS